MRRGVIRDRLLSNVSDIHRVMHDLHPAFQRGDFEERQETISHVVKVAKHTGKAILIWLHQFMRGVLPLLI